MSIRKNNVLLALANSYLIDSPQPSSISYWWNLGSLLGLTLVIQILTGVTLAMHYSSNLELAFISVEHIMRDVNFGWLIRYMHANGASFFFILVYGHMGRGMYYGSYRQPRVLVWIIGVLLFLFMIITAFLGYVLPAGQMSLWGSTVITNLMSAIPWIGDDIVTFLWGGFSVNNATFQRFFSLHYLLPFLLAALTCGHLLALHEHGSNNPLGTTGNIDRLGMHPYFIFKDLVTVFAFLFFFSFFVFFAPNAMGHPDNYIPANPMVTPSSIVPEWYLLPFYAILRAIPDKLGGVIAMVAAIFILMALPWVDRGFVRGNAFRKFSQVAYWVFMCNFFLLMGLGGVHIEEPFVFLGQISTVYYFAHFVIILPLVTLAENVLFEISQRNN